MDAGGDCVGALFEFVLCVFFGVSFFCKWLFFLLVFFLLMALFVSFFLNCHGLKGKVGNKNYVSVKIVGKI